MKDIEVYRIAETKVNREEVGRWLDKLGADEVELDDSGISDPSLLVALAAKRCYNSFQPGLNPNVTRIRKDWVEYLDNILASGHGSVLEHSCYTYAIEGCTRVFTAEMNRHRAGVGISEASLRYIRFEKEGIDLWLPPSLQEDDPTFYCDEMTVDEVEGRKEETIQRFLEVLNKIQEEYNYLCELWGLDTLKSFGVKKKITSMLRRIVPLGVQVGGVWTMNLRAMRHIISMRYNEHAEEEICMIFSMILSDIMRSNPELFGDFLFDCETGYHVPRYWKV